jgi:hypothetical protein
MTDREGSIHRAGGTDLRRAREIETQGHWPRRAYQIETPSMLIAIEFFLAVVITFSSLGRSIRPLPCSKHDENQVIRGA